MFTFLSLIRILMTMEMDMKIIFKILLVGFLSFPAYSQNNPTAPTVKMNVIFILADDLGWSDCTLYGNTTLYKTPNLERLAKRGMTFSNAHSASPLCSPSRASILTGQTPARTGITNALAGKSDEVLLQPKNAESDGASPKILPCISANRLNTNVQTLGKILKAQGYATAHFGKWHLGNEPYSPYEHGFDEDIPHWPGTGPAGGYIAPWQFPNFKEKKPNEHIEDRMADEAVEWMSSLDINKPFYMNFWQFSVHAPLKAKANLIDFYRSNIDMTKNQRSPTYAAMVHSMDDAVGKLLDEIDRLGIADRTIIVFTSDNGGNISLRINETTKNGQSYLTAPTDNSPLRGGKGTIFEGGIRVPCVVVMPGVTALNKKSDALIQSTDFYPTLLNKLGIPLPVNHILDGVDISPALKGATFNRKPMFTFFPHINGSEDNMPPSIAVTEGDFKLIRQFYQGDICGKHEYLLYDLGNDIGEKNNLATTQPTKVNKLDALIENYLSATNAVVPIPNPRARACNILSVSENIFGESRISVFPNPSTDGIFNLSQNSNWKVTSILGNQILEGNGDIINLQGYPKGIYLIKLGEVINSVVIE